MATGVPKTNTRWAKTDFADFSPGGFSATLMYEGKQPEVAILATLPATPHVLWNENAAPNRLYYGDNLPILAHLLNDPQVCGQVRLVYIDPPYATKGVFQSRTQVDAYHDLLTGPEYIEFLRQRLVLLRELLAEDGSIYVHLDHNMAFHIKVIMDEVFGEKNFRNFITRRKSSHKNYTRKTYGNIADYILFYTKSASYVWNRPVESWTDERSIKEYNCIEADSGRRFKKVPVHAPGVRNGATGGTWQGKLPPPGKHWQYTPDELDRMDGRGEIYWSANGNPRRKIYLDKSEGVPLQDIWHGFRDSQNQNAKITGYPTEKNSAMLDVIIEASSNPGDFVLDCFAGSGTTLHEASRLKRRWIGADESPEALETMLRRFAHGATSMGDYVTKSEKPAYQQLRLLGSGDTAENEAEQLNLQSSDGNEKHHPVTDFALFGSEPATGEVKHLVQCWQDWI